MRALETHSKEQYKEDYIKTGGDVLEFRSIDEAIQAYMYIKGRSEDDARYALESDFNVNWISFNDGTALYRYHDRTRTINPRKYIESLKDFFAELKTQAEKTVLREA